MHDAGGDRSQTIAALPTIIRTLRARGFHLVTVPQLLAEDPPPPANRSHRISAATDSSASRSAYLGMS